MNHSVMDGGHPARRHKSRQLHFSPLKDIAVVSYELRL